MACFACILLFAVLTVNVAVNSTELNINNDTTTLKPITLENSTEDSFRARPLRPVSVGNKQKTTAGPKINSTNFQKLDLEKRIPPNKIYRDINTVGEFWKKRNALADSEVQKLLGSRMPLDEKELEANKIVLSRKFVEYDKSFSSTETFPPSISFFQAKALIDESDIYQIIRKVPKGGTLFSILIAAVPFSFMYELTFEDNLYYLFDENLQFKFSRTSPGPAWRLLSEIRDTDIEEFLQDLNSEIQQRLSIIPNLTDEASAPTFREVLHVYSNLTTYRPNFEKTLEKALEVLYEDNVMYADFYYDFPEVYDLDGRIYSPAETVNLAKTVLNDFISTHADFIGVRFIYSPIVALSEENVSEFRRASTQLWRTHPDLVAGFAVVIMEEDEEPYSTWIEEFLKFPKEMKLFLDGGLTNSWGIDADYNLLDAVALNSATIGAGVALNKHPVVVEKLRKKNVAVKSCPTATQVLGLVDDLRRHTLTILVASDFPIVFVNVGGAAWNATGLSYDWYEAYMAMTPRFCDLRCLKQLAVNSLLHSNLSNEEKKRSIKLWHKKWDEFIDFVIDNYDVKR